MKVLILAAGYGTRLYPLTINNPKPLLDCCGQPIINYLLEKIKDISDLSEVLVVSNEKFTRDFKKWAAAIKNFPAPIRIMNDGTTSPDNRLGAMGDIRFAIQKKNISEGLLVIGGDNMFDRPLKDFLDFARQKENHMTMGCFDIHNKLKAKKFGVVELDNHHRVVSFEEKPKNPRSALIAMCLYYLPKNSLRFLEEYFRESQKMDTTGDYVQWLYQCREVYGFKFDGKWYDIGSLESYQEAQKDFSRQNS